MKGSGLRVGGGRFKRSEIKGPKSHRGHHNATSARVKEAAFQLVRNRVDIDATWIFYDLFAGSGQMGIEALSLGAAHSTFVDIAQERLSEIARSLDALDVPTDAFTLVRARSNKIFAEAFENMEQPVVVWADPPYTYGHEVSNDPAQLVQLYRLLAVEHSGRGPNFIMQVHEKSPVLADEFLAANADIQVYRYGSNCLITLP